MPEDSAAPPVANDMPPSYEETKGLTETNMPEVKIDMKGDKPAEPQDGFQGLTKEELMKYAADPFWVRLRWALFLLFWAVWVAMLVASVVIIVYAPKCPSPEPKEWWQKSPIYKVDLDTFPKKEEQLSALANLEEALDYTVAQGFGTIYITGGSTLAELPSGGTEYGTAEEWKSLMEAVKARYQYVVVDFDGNTQEWMEFGVDGFIVPGTDVVLSLEEARKTIDLEAEISGSDKVLIGISSPDDNNEAKIKLLDTYIKNTEETPSPTSAADMKVVIDNYMSGPNNSWPGISLKSAEYGDEYVDAITMIKMLLPATLMLNAGEELGMKEMNWAAVKDQESLDVDSHLNLFGELSQKLRHQDAILFGEFNMNTTFVIGDVFGMARVKKGNPGYLLLSNFGVSNVTVAPYYAMPTVPASIRVMAKSTTPEREDSKTRTFKSRNVPLLAMETKIFTFVPTFDLKTKKEEVQAEVEGKEISVVDGLVYEGEATDGKEISVANYLVFEEEKAT